MRLWFYYPVRFLVRLICRGYFRLTRRGVDRLPRHGGCIVAPNHVSHLDPVLVGVLVPRPVHFMARRTLFRPAWWGRVIAALGAVPLDREGIGKDCFQRLLALLERGEVVVIFPEGTRSPGDELGRFKAGAVRLARKAGVPVVPTYVEGSGRALGKGRGFPRPVRVTVHYGESLPVSAETDEEEMLTELRARIEQLGASARTERAAAATSERSPAG